MVFDEKYNKDGRDVLNLHFSYIDLERSQVYCYELQYTKQNCCISLNVFRGDGEFYAIP